MNSKLIWGSWAFMTIAAGIYFSTKLFSSEDKSMFLIGESTYGHYQIELACETCHTEPFGGPEILQDACTQCHASELDEAHDSHPKSKFTDPRNADRLEILDGRYCVTCHAEHQREFTHNMGLTLPENYCYHCHQEVSEDRPSHQNLAYDSCASAGCHNYHDNRALYEDFLVENAHQKKHFVPTEVDSIPNAVALLDKKAPVTVETSEHQIQISNASEITHEWENSSHAKAGIDCGGCHTNKGEADWIDKPGYEQCENCHQNEYLSFSQGKHGMRLAGDLSAKLSPIEPGKSHLPFKAEATGIQHGCNACHQSHQFDTDEAATSACLSCHADDHSLAFPDSPHAKIETAQVTCASCHMPRHEVDVNGQKVLAVQHNQNWNLKPNEKMIRSVCMNCHSLRFSINALADPSLIDNNFSGEPSVNIESIDWALKRLSNDK